MVNRLLRQIENPRIGMLWRSGPKWAVKMRQDEITHAEEFILHPTWPRQWRQTREKEVISRHNVQNSETFSKRPWRQGRLLASRNSPQKAFQISSYCLGVINTCGLTILIIHTVIQTLHQQDSDFQGIFSTHMQITRNDSNDYDYDDPWPQNHDLVFFCFFGCDSGHDHEINTPIMVIQTASETFSVTWRHEHWKTE